MKASSITSASPCATSTRRCAFYRDALGLEVEASEEVASQRVRAHFIPVGQASARTARGDRRRSRAIAQVRRASAARACTTSRCASTTSRAALAQLKARGVRLIDEQPRPGAEGALVAFIHPSSAHGVLVELKQARRRARRLRPPSPSRRRCSDSRWATSSSISLVRRLLPARRRRDVRRRAAAAVGGQGAAGRSQPHSAGDAAARRARRAARCSSTPGSATRRTRSFAEIYGVDRGRHLDHALAEAGVAPEDIDIVLATHLHFDHAGGFTVRDAVGTAAAAVSAGALRRPARRVGGRDPSARAQPRQLPGGQLRAARRRRRAGARRATIRRSCRACASSGPAGTRRIIRWSGIESGGRQRRLRRRT